jgi:hypothetical protein
LGYVESPSGEDAVSEEAWKEFHEKSASLQIESKISKENYRKLYKLCVAALQSQKMTNINHASNAEKEVVTIKLFHTADISMSFTSVPGLDFTGEVKQLKEFVMSMELPNQLPKRATPAGGTP